MTGCAARGVGGTRLVRPHRGRREALGVAVLVLLILTAMAWRFAALERAPQTSQLKPYQRLDGRLSASSHLVFRALLSSVSDVEELRAQEGQWPEAVLLEEDGIPPFSPDSMPANAGALEWVSYDGGSWVDYLGTDTTRTNEISYVLRLIDLHAGYHPHPHPGIDYDPDLTLAAQVWVFDEGGRSYPGERLPEAGWSWVLSRFDPILSGQSPSSESANEPAG